MTRPAEGTIFRIDCGAGPGALGLVSSDPMIVFFHPASYVEDNPYSIVECQELFRVFVENGFWKHKAWQKSGHIELPEYFKVIPYTFKYDVIADRFYRYHHSAGDLKANIEECIALEPAAVWSASHITDRLRDSLSGTPNRWLADLRRELVDAAKVAPRPPVQSPGKD